MLLGKICYKMISNVQDQIQMRYKLGRENNTYQLRYGCYIISLDRNIIDTVFGFVDLVW